MQDENDLMHPLDPAEQELEAALAAMNPSPGTLRRRDDLIFAAGAQSTRRTLRLWQSGAAMLAACLAMSIVLRIEPKPHDLAQSPAPSATRSARVDSTPLSRSPYSLASLRTAMLGGGGDAMPPEPPTRTSTPHHPPETPSLRSSPSSYPPFGDPL